MEYSNKYGIATLTPVGPIIHVSKVNGAEVIGDGYGHDIDTAAKLALVTENHKLQPAYNMALKKCYVLFHHTPSTVQVCRLDALVCHESDPHGTLDLLNRCAPAMMY